MTSGAAPKREGTFRFADFELDFARRTLSRRGIRLKLQNQPWQVLALLIERAPAIVSREEIRRRVWGDNVYIDVEPNINFCIRQIRGVLLDNAAHSRYIETLPREGYRFVAPLNGSFEDAGVVSDQTASAGAPPDLLEAPIQEAPVKPRRPRWLIAAIALPGLVMVSFALWLGTREQLTSVARLSPVTFEAELRANPLTSYPGTEAGPSFSPDGTRVAFSWDGPKQDNVDIYVKLIGPGEAVRLTRNPADDHDPAWSPDGSWIAFVRDLNDGERAIMLIPALGGTERTVALTREGTNHLTSSPALSWSADGKCLFALDAGNMTGETRAVVRVSVDSGEKEQVTFPPGQEFDDSVAVSPDGRTVAFTRAKSSPWSELYILPLTEKSIPWHEPKLVLTGAWITGIAWTPDSHDVVFSGEMNGRAGFWRLEPFGLKKPYLLNGLGGKSIRLKRVGRDHGVNLSISSVGRRFVYNEGSYDVNIWRLRLAGLKKGSVAPLISSTKDELQPDYSPDGRRIAFESDRSGCEEIWVSDSDGSVPFQVTNFKTGWSGSPRWSPDGQNIAFDRLGEPKKWAIYVVNSQGGRSTLLTTNAGDNSAPSWSRDGRWIYFASDRTGRSQVWKVQSTGGPEIQVTENGGMLPLESIDGKYLYYTGAGEPGQLTLFKMPTAGGKESKVFDYLISSRAYAVARYGVYSLQSSRNSERQFGNSLDREVPLRLFDFKTRKIATVGWVQTNNLAGRIAISPDERWMLYGHDDGTGGDLMLVENFR